MATLLDGPPSIRMAMSLGISVKRVREIIDKNGNAHAEEVMRRLQRFREYKKAIETQPAEKDNKKDGKKGIPPEYCPT